ncbi:MAG TPA: hypothetical protein VGM88_04440 [Kofleriaceae bacterium]
MIYRYPSIVVTDTDAPGFVEAVDRIAAGLVFRYRPRVVCLVRIWRWFDHRWLRFSGIGRVPFASAFARPEVSLDPFWQDQLTFPPFHPRRIRCEHHWQRRADGEYDSMPYDQEPHFVHDARRRRTRHNLHRRVADRADSALYAWFSTSASEARASIMVYVVNDGETIPWFASMRREADEWRLAEVKGLGRPEIEELLWHPPGVFAREAPRPL